MRNVHLIDHPLVQHKLTLMRQKSVSTSSFRRLLNELAALMTYEVTRDMPTHEVEIETPLEKMKGRMIDGKKLPPNPKIATVEPGSTLAVFNTAPIPVVMPQPKRHTFSKGAALLILAKAISGTTVYSEKVEVPI